MTRDLCARGKAGTHWPQIVRRLDDLDWALRYAPHTLSTEDRLLAASVVAAYRALVVEGKVKP